MELTRSPEDLFTPGDARNFFDIADLPPFDPDTRAIFNRGNALWMSEFSRLIYRQKANKAGLSRADELRRKNWNEHAFFDEEGTQAGIFTPADGGCAVVVFRGTMGGRDMITDLQVPMTFWDGHGQVHIGFLEALNHVWHSLKAALNAISGPVFYTGHSLGAALATMAAARAQSDTKLGNPAAIYTFGSPRVGDAGFRKNFGSVFHARIVNDCDIVTSMPPVLALPTCPLYQHCGQEHRLLASGAMETGVADSDTVAERTVAGRIGDLVGNVVGMMKSAAGERGFPQHLIDHTPQNYTARLEKLPPYSSGKPRPPAPV